MFLETAPHDQSTGYIEVICGSMFSGKTEELIRRLNRANIAKLNVKIFKPALDTRYDKEKVVTHNKNSIDSIPVKNCKEILKHVENVDVIGIDEVQFFSDDLVDICNTLTEKGIRVIVAGLDMDFMGDPFGPIPKLLATAEFVTKLHAICVKCGQLASFNHRKVKGDAVVMLGAKDVYEALCRCCYQKARKIENPEIKIAVQSGRTKTIKLEK